MRVLGQVSDPVKGQLVAGLDSTKIQAGVVHRLIDVASFARMLTLLQGSEDTDKGVHAGVGVSESRAALGRNVVFSFIPSRGRCGSGRHLGDRLIGLEVLVA